MIKELVISNYALIDRLDITFKTGITSITGETGAGKSILLGGLSLLLGKRADLTNLKDPSKKCFVEGVFNIKKYRIESLFKKNNIDYDNETIIRREIIPSGKSRAFINDTPVKLDTLFFFGQNLVDIHSQSQTTFLTNSDYQLDLLDGLAQNFEYRKQFKDKLLTYNKINLELDSFTKDYETLLKELDYISFLKDELEESNFDKIPYSDLEEELKKNENIEEIGLLLKKTLELINNESFGLRNNLSELFLNFNKLNSLSNDFSDLRERINVLKIETDDISSEIESRIERLIYDPDRTDFLNEKINQINSLFKKHNVNSFDELVNVKNSLDKKMEKSNELSLKIESLKKVKLNIFSELEKISFELNKRRNNAIPIFKNQISEILSNLGMSSSKFKIEINKTNKFKINGSDTISFEFASNKGSSFKDLKKIASGGELSRIMFSIKIILSRFKSLPTIIFDEIDTGTSGDISTKIARLMLEMSKTMQVLVISHSPQVASIGDNHIKVYKDSSKNTTVTKLKLLSSKERIIEIADMLGGGSESLTAVQHAKQLLN